MQSRLANIFKKLTGFFLIALAPTLLHAQGHYKVGTAATAVPFNFYDSKTSQLKGAMIDIAHAVAKQANFTIEIESMTFGAMIPAVQAGRVDFISAAMVKSAERAKIVDWTDPFYAYSETLVVKASDQTDYTTLDPLQGEIVGAEADTLYARMLMAKGGFKEIRTYETLIDIVRDVERGRLKGGIIDRPIISYYMKQGELGFLKNVRVAQEYKSNVIGDVGFVVRKNNPELLAILNKAITELKANGTIARILNEWGV